MKTRKPFLTDKGCLYEIIHPDGEETITNDRILGKRFNEQYINIVERSSGFKPSKTPIFMESVQRSSSLRQNALNNTHMEI